MAEHKSTQHAGPDAGAHSYRIATHAPRSGGRVLFSRLTFRAVCACGWESEPMPTAGLAHAAHDAHAAPTEGWEGTWAMGGGTDGYVAVMVSREVES